MEFNCSECKLLLNNHKYFDKKITEIKEIVIFFEQQINHLIQIDHIPLVILFRSLKHLHSKRNCLEIFQRKLEQTSEQFINHFTDHLN